MVRFQWHVEDGLGASVGPGQLVYLRDHGVLQAMVEIEMPGGSSTLEGCMNIPQNYNTDSGVKELGIVIAHGSEASDWRGRLLAELAVSLARSGFLVMRYICHANASEARRIAVFDKATDVAATSPYARGVTRWVLAGLGDGARVAALAGSRVRSAVAGFVFLSYPLKEEMPDLPGEDMASAHGATDSSAPLLGLAAPMLFLSASNDPLICETALVELGPRLLTSDVRSVVLQDVDSHFRTLTGKGPHAATIRAVNAAFHEFVNATNAYRMDFCKLPRIWRGGAAAGALSVAAAENGGNKREERPQLQRAACFRPIPSGPPPNAQQQQPLALQASLSYGLNATAAQALAAQIQQRQASSLGASGTGGNAAQLLAQQVLLQQAAQAAQRRSSDQADVGPASVAAAAAAKLAAAARGGGVAAGAAAPNQLAGLAHVLSDPTAAAQIAAMLLRNSASQQQQQLLQVPLQLGAATVDGGVGSGTGRTTTGPTNALLQALAPTAVSSAAAGGGASTGGAGQGNQGLTMEALTSALVQRLAQQQQPPQQQHVVGHSAAASPLVTLQSGPAGQLLAATLLNQQQQQQQLQLGAGSAAAALQQQQLQQLLLQHQRQQQQQQQRQQLTLQLQEQLLQRQQEQQGHQRSQQGMQQALLLQSQAGSLPVLQAALLPTGLGQGNGRAAALAGPGGVLMLHTTPSGSALGAGEDVDMTDAGPS